MSQTTEPSLSYAGAIKRVYSKYAEFSGRAGRPEFWWFVVYYCIALAVCGLFTFVDFGGGNNLGSLLASLFTLATLLPGLAVGVRRLRDAGMDWRAILWLLLPIAGIIILAIYWSRPSVPE